MATTDLLIAHGELTQTRLRTRDDTPLAPGQVRVRVDRLALTSNNVTYAGFGQAMHYWDFYPSGEDGWGIVPVWGFGDVVQSLHPGVAVGERLYGFWPSSTHAVLTPDRLSPQRFADAAPHRSGLAGVYNQYFRTALDPLYRADDEDVQALMRPLFITSWLIADHLADNDFFGARDANGRATVLLSSASSKTAYGTAWALSRHPGVEVVGLTSPANEAFCRELGCYQRMLSYDSVEQLAADTPCVFVDFAGNGQLRRTVHTHFAGLAHSLAIGSTHLSEVALPGSGKQLPGPRMVFFFAPDQIRKRTQEWGAQAFGERMADAWRAFSERVTDAGSPWLRVEHTRGMASMPQVWTSLAAGRLDPRVGHVIEL
ncbi:DUF2855 family protein [Variovorax dokdonensis]|uniref:DUF2855 family protein n=1 Tax=Variovorax dokdonensis TaxID=344883 RepID=A0ABT7NAW9_9BURK|nr:DUF2855 family protein [Variovorax dokdonensis]MDM0045090.1 DUF2855 family protein [Variovorax dokdonensis]